MSASGLRAESFKRSKVTQPVDHEAIKTKYAGFQQGKRIAPRYAIQFEVILFSRSKSFRTKSVNVSASGALLQDFLPREFITETFDIVIICHGDNRKKHMSFRGRAIGGPRQSSRIVFTASSRNAQEDLFKSFEDLTPVGHFLP